MTQTAEQIEKNVRDTLENGTDIYQKVRSITLKALTERDLDSKNIQQVLEAVFTGMREGAGDQYEPAKEAFTQTVAAIDDALSKTAHATQLAIEEASSKIDEISYQDYNQAQDNIHGLENIFLETMEKITKSSETLFEVSGDFIKHARQNGTMVGENARIALEALDKLRKHGEKSISSEAAAATSIVSKIGSGILAGIAESFDTKNRQ